VWADAHADHVLTTQQNATWRLHQNRLPVYYVTNSNKIPQRRFAYLVCVCSLVCHVRRPSTATLRLSTERRMTRSLAVACNLRYNCDRDWRRQRKLEAATLRIQASAVSNLTSGRTQSIYCERIRQGSYNDITVPPTPPPPPPHCHTSRHRTKQRVGYWIGEPERHDGLVGVATLPLVQCGDKHTCARLVSRDGLPLVTAAKPRRDHVTNIGITNSATQLQCGFKNLRNTAIRIWNNVKWIQSTKVSC
jgi:hypothetical protein